MTFTYTNLEAYDLNHMQGKITKMWLANEEGIFS